MMRTTLDLPDSLLRRLKARAAMEGMSMKDLVARYVTAGLQSAESGRADRVAETPGPVVAFVSAYDVLQDGIGIVDSGIPDLATNPQHMDGFGLD